MHPNDAPAAVQPELVVGRYSVFRAIGRGGMAAVHLGRLGGPLGFSRTVAIKRIHKHLARDGQMVAMFVDEARLASRVQHPNVVATLDILHEGEHLFLVMDFVLGQALSALLGESRRRMVRVPIPIAARIIVDVLAGLHAAHGATDTRGQPLRIVHRDVSPHNVLVGIDGVARVADFGIAKATVRLAKTLDGRLKGKVRYMAPEQLLGGEITHRVDIYAAGVTLWELLTSSRRFEIETDEVVLRNPMRTVDPPSHINPGVPPELDRVVLRALSNAPEERFADALEMAGALEESTRCASTNEVASWVADIGAERIAELRSALREIERTAPPQSMSPSLQMLIPELRSQLPTTPDPEPGPMPESDEPQTVTVTLTDGYQDEVATTVYRAGSLPLDQNAQFTEAGTEIIRPAPALDEPEADEPATTVSRFEPELATEPLRPPEPPESPEPPEVKTRVVYAPPIPPLAGPSSGFPSGAPSGEPERANTWIAFLAGGLIVLATVLLLTVIWQCAAGNTTL